MEFERKTLLQALGENKDEASKAALISRLRNGEIKAEGRLIYPEAMEQGQIVLAQFQEIPREHWDFDNVDFETSEIRNNFVWTKAGNSDQQKWVEVSVFLVTSEIENIMNKEDSPNGDITAKKYRKHLAPDAIREVYRSLLPKFGVDMTTDEVFKAFSSLYKEEKFPFIQSWENKGTDRKRVVFVWKNNALKARSMRYDNLENIVSKERDKYRKELAVKS